MEKICFVVGLYGDEVNGGAEKHCKMLAEQASNLYDVEVLTSTTNDYKTFTPFYPEGITHLNGVAVRRFNSKPFDRVAFDQTYKKSRWGRKIRRLLYRTGLLKYIASIFPSWNIDLAKELKTLKLNGLYAPDLVDFLVTNEQDYQAIFLLSYPCPNFYFINKRIPHRCILIPTAHDEGDFFRSYLSHIFTTVRHIAFNTEMERVLCYRIFGNKMAPSSILAVGTELSEASSYTHIQEKYKLPEQYILYFGRIAKEKIGDLIDWFLEYKATSNDTVKLVLTGGIFMEKRDHPDIIYTGFVSEPEKTALIEYAQLVINPSDRESLSLLLLETMQLGQLSLVNGKSDVLKQHCIDSDFAAQYYISKSDFIHKLSRMLASDRLDEKEQQRQKAIRYVAKNYSWDKVMERLKGVVNSSLSEKSAQS